MRKKRSLVLCIMLLVVSSLVFSVRGAGVQIKIDGNFVDWEGIAPVFVDGEIHPGYWIDVQQGYVAANDTTLFIRLDYAAPLDYWDSLLGNITIRTPSNKIYILMYQIVYESHPFWSFSAIFPGRNLSSFLNDRTSLEYVDYQNSVAIDLTTNSTVEYYFLLEDLGLQLSDTIDIAFWHYENKSAGEYTVLLHRFAGIAYQVALNPVIDVTYGESSITTTDIDSSISEGSQQSTIPNITPVDSLGLILSIATILFIQNRRQRKNGK